MTIYLNSADAKMMGFHEILAQCRCRSPQGNRLKANRHFYTRADQESLQEEFSAIADLMILLEESPRQAAEAQRVLSQFRELRSTLQGLENQRLLDETEFFELKRALLHFRQIADLEPLTRAARVRVSVLDEAQQLLDPAGTGAQGFHIYSAYSEQLSRIRKRKREIEARLECSSEEEDRYELLKQRNLFNAEEDAEEERIRKELGIRLLKWLPELRADFEACAVLDFRLAKAELARQWRANKPQIVGPEAPAEICDAWQPLVQETLEKTGAVFTAQTIRLERGATILTGANMGGKSVALQTCFLAIAMAQLGYFPPCKALKTPLYDFLSFSTGESGDFKLGLSAFGMEALRIRDDYRRSQTRSGLVIMDEPCRGTNPREATAIIQALCQAYSRSKASLLIATHYKVVPAKGLRFYRLKGIRALDELPASSGMEDQELIRLIQELMDFQIVEIVGQEDRPSAAIQVAQLLGMDAELIQTMQNLWKEEGWQK